MNWAEMIEEKKLKKAFIIATLCSTLTGTFSSSINLWDIIKDKRKQEKRDTDQDKEIQQLRKQVEEKSQNSSSHQRRSPPPSRGGRQDDEVAYALEQSGAAIRREFDEGYQRMGRRFAIGDSVTENRLQAQVIALQQTVIDVLQDALANGRQLDGAAVRKLIAASHAARDGSLDALRQQRQRQQQEQQQEQLLAIEAAPSRAGPPAPLYCRYSLDLQHGRNKPLAASFAPGGDCRCPACGVRLQAESDDFWEIEKRARGRKRDDGRRGGSEVVLDEREFYVGQRFVVKCHTPDGGFACVLCSRFRDEDVICATADKLMHHIGRDHDIEELEREEDFEMRSRLRPIRKALPAS